MVDSQSETYSKEEYEKQIATLVDENEKLAESLRWNSAILSVLLQEAGGVVEIAKETLLGITWEQVNATVRLDEERDVYIVDGNFDGTE